jgi:hypothetical protein
MMYTSEIPSFHIAPRPAAFSAHEMAASQPIYTALLTTLYTDRRVRLRFRLDSRQTHAR